MRPDSPRQEELAEVLRTVCPTIEYMLKSVPAFNPQWETLAHDKFQDMFQFKFNNS